MATQRTPACDSLQPRLAAYALGEVDDADDLAAHVAGCPTCQRDLKRYRQVARVLPHAAPEATPPPALKARILEAATASAMPAAVAPVPLRPRRAAWRLPAAPWRAIGAAAIILGLLGWNLSLQSRLREATAEVVESRAGWATTTALLNDPTVRAVALEGNGASGHIWATDQGDVGCLVVEGLADLPEGQVYQIWLRENGQPVGVGTFETRGGSTWVLIWPQQPLARFDSIGITVEPSGGSPAPTGTRVLFGALDALGAAPASSAVVWN